MRIEEIKKGAMTENSKGIGNNVLIIDQSYGAAYFNHQNVGVLSWDNISDECIAAIVVNEEGEKQYLYSSFLKESFKLHETKILDSKFESFLKNRP